MQLVIQKKSISEFEEIEKSIFDNDQTFEQMHETWKVLDDFFNQNSYERDFDWRLTYFRVYVRLTWKVLGTIIDNNKFVEIMGRQVPMAILLDVDVLKEMMWYLDSNKADKSKLVSLYQKIKTAFFESEQIMGSWQGQDVAVKDLVSEYLLLHKRHASSMEGAEFLSKLEQIMFTEEADPYTFVDYDDGIDRFLELIEFLQETTNEKIWLTVDAFSNPEKYNSANPERVISKPEPEEEVRPSEPTPQNLATKYESMSQKLEQEVEASKKEEAKPVAPAPVPVVPIVKIEPVKPVVVKPAPQETPAAEPQVRLTAGQIKSQIESEFKKDLDGNFINIEGVMRKLEEFTEMYNDPKIADMIYYDEEDDKFKWKV